MKQLKLIASGSNWSTLKTWVVSLFLFFILIVLQNVFQNKVFAAEWAVTSDINLQNQSDTNRSLTTVQHESVSAVSVIPRVILVRETDLTKNTISGQILSTRYSDDTIRNTNVQKFDYGHKYKGIRNTINIRGKFRQDTTLTALNDIEPDSDVLDIGDIGDSDLGLIKFEVRRKFLTIEPAWSFDLSESYKMSLKYGLNKRFYSKTTNLNLVEFDENSIEFALNKKLNEKDTISYGVVRSDFNPDNSDKTEDSAIKIGYRRNISMLSDMVFELGARRTDSPTDSTRGSLFKLTYKYKGEISRLIVDLKRDVSGSGIGSLVENTQLDLRYTRRISALTSFLLRTKMLDLKTLENNTGSNRILYSIEPQLRFQLSRNFSTEFSYRYRREDFENTAESADSNAIFLGIRYSFDRLATRT